MEHSKLPFTARGNVIEDAYGLIVADTNQSCGLTRGLDLANAELLATCANLHGELLGLVIEYASLVGNTGYTCRDNRDVCNNLWLRAKAIIDKCKSARVKIEDPKEA